MYIKNYIKCVQINGVRSKNIRCTLTLEFDFPTFSFVSLFFQRCDVPPPPSAMFLPITVKRLMNSVVQ